MEHLSKTQFQELNQSEREYHLYEISCENNKMLKIHEPVITRILKYEEAGRTTGKFMMRIFFSALGAAIVVWLTNHFGTK
jgi:hypothetical protein